MPTARHLTVDELAERIAAHAGAVDRASVYRTLGLLKELGLVRATQLSPSDPVRWERAHPDEHFHLQCSVCGGVEHHEGDLVARILEHLDVGHGFAVAAVDLTVTGVCADCRRRSDA
jgi:Fur family transcriptional regulator, ferric uptake regulator